MTVQYLTCKFKIHNPSAHKRAVMDHALEQYTLGYSDLLEYASDNLDHIRHNGVYANGRTGEEKFTAMSIKGLLPRAARGIHSSAKESLQQDVAANLASFLALEKSGAAVSFPSVPSTENDADIDCLDYFVRVGSNLEDYNTSKDAYLRNAKKSAMPLYFARSDGAAQTSAGAARGRNFSLLATATRDKLLAALWLLPNRHELCRPLNAKQGNLVKLDSGEIFVSNSSVAILVPLELGRNGWQEFKFIESAIKQESSVKTAYLVRDDRSGEYYLHVAFEFECPKLYEPQAYLGVDRGVFFSMAYAVVDKVGNIVLMDSNEDGYRDEMITASKKVQKKQQDGKSVNIKDYRRKELEAILHRLVNRIINVALEHQAMIVTEDLNIQIKGKFYKSAWAKMYKYLEYKCRLAGVPLWKGGIWAAYSSQICVMCGERNEGRQRGQPFNCPNCGAVYHSDSGAGVNIARRALYRKDDWKDRGGYMAFHRSFANGGGLIAESDLRQVAVPQPDSGLYVYA